MRSGIQNLALLKSDYEGGLCSRQKIAENHSISAVTLWRVSKKRGLGIREKERASDGGSFTSLDDSTDVDEIRHTGRACFNTLSFKRRDNGY